MKNIFNNFYERGITMETEKKLAFLQYTYAASVAETVDNYDKLKVLDEIVEKKKEMQAQSAKIVNHQLGIETVEDVFTKFKEIFGCANWSVEKTKDGYIATATKCKLCEMSKIIGESNPCNGWCLDPMFAMIVDISSIAEKNIIVGSTLLDGDCCMVHIKRK